jgi:hypothetical protein
LSESYLLKETHLAACLAARFTSPISSYRTRSFIDLDGWMGQKFGCQLSGKHLILRNSIFTTATRHLPFLSYYKDKPTSD